MQISIRETLRLALQELFPDVPKSVFDGVGGTSSTVTRRRCIQRRPTATATVRHDHHDHHARHRVDAEHRRAQRHRRRADRPGRRPCSARPRPTSPPRARPAPATSTRIQAAVKQAGDAAGRAKVLSAQGGGGGGTTSTDDHAHHRHRARSQGTRLPARARRATQERGTRGRPAPMAATICSSSARDVAKLSRTCWSQPAPNGGPSLTATRRSSRKKRGRVVEAQRRAVEPRQVGALGRAVGDVGQLGPEQLAEQPAVAVEVGDQVARARPGRRRRRPSRRRCRAGSVRRPRTRGASASAPRRRGSS